MENKIPGLHHVTAIASDPQRNLDFYVALLGLRFVKRTVNFDDPGSYHFYFGDNRGTPGTILTFFPWPGARRGIRGTGQIEATAFAISSDSIGYWLDRFKEHHVTAEKISRFGEEGIRFIDPDGLLLELIAVGRRVACERRAVAGRPCPGRTRASRFSQCVGRLGRLRKNSPIAHGQFRLSFDRRIGKPISLCITGR